MNQSLNHKMSFWDYAKHVWSPILLGVHFAGFFMCSYGEWCFDFVEHSGFIVGAIIIFYGTHYLTYRLARSVITDLKKYWFANALSYLPFTLSLWGLYFVDPTQLAEPFDLGPLAYPFLGLVLTALLYGVLLWKMLEYDLDWVLGLLFLNVIFAGILGALFTWLVTLFGPLLY